MKFLIEKKLHDYDYGTKPVKFVGNIPIGDLIDTSTLGGFSNYDEYLKPENIERMTCKQYFDYCEEIFNVPASIQIKETLQDKLVMEHLHDVIYEDKKTFPMPFLNFKEKTQEGRHRVYAIADIKGWGKSIPVLVIR